jgi:S-adenosyl-L-methionine hydrolase (adenosine-forming)
MQTAVPRFPVITLTTDFGLEDHYVGTMKGVILSRCPDVQMVDISHQIQPFSIHAGAYAIDQAAWYFPPRTVHVVVVDPGVGTSRRALVAEVRDQLFVAPDNGVLSIVLSRDRSGRKFEANNPTWWLPLPSHTFHGRDVFAPVAAALANGAARLEDIGSPLANVELLDGLEVVQKDDQTWAGTILSVDHFGNLITNFPVAEFAWIKTNSFGFESSGHRVSTFRRTFAEAPPGVYIAYFGSSGYIEIGFDRQNAAERLGIGPGSPVTLHRVRDPGA